MGQRGAILLLAKILYSQRPQKCPKCLQVLLQTLTLLELDTLQVERVPQHVAAPRLVLLGEEQQVGVDKEGHLEAREQQRSWNQSLGTEKGALPCGDAPAMTGGPGPASRRGQLLLHPSGCSRQASDKPPPARQPPTEACRVP